MTPDRGSWSPRPEQNSPAIDPAASGLKVAELAPRPVAAAGWILFAEAGKKKKKEKSEVVVISVNNPSKGHGQMYPVFIPSCGGHSGGYGRRRKRSII